MDEFPMTALCSFMLLAALAAPTSPVEQPRHETSQPVAVPEASPEALAYYRGGNVLWIVSQAMALAIPALVLLSGLSVRIRDLARRAGRKWFLIILIYFVLYSVLQGALHFPLAYYAGFVRQHAYGLSNQTFAKWLVRLARARGRRNGLRRTADLGAVLADRPQPAAMVALYRDPLAACHVLQYAR